MNSEAPLTPFWKYNNLAKYYLLAAEICVSERLNRGNNKIHDYNSGLDNGGILMPIFFLVKHALELHIKSFYIILYKKQIHGHNVNNLWIRFKKDFPNNESIKNFNIFFEKYELLTFNNQDLFLKTDSNNTTMRYPERASENLNLTSLISISSLDILKDLNSIHKNVEKTLLFLQRHNMNLNKN